jgi:hypothetical protein
MWVFLYLEYGKLAKLRKMLKICIGVSVELILEDNYIEDIIQETCSIFNLENKYPQQCANSY